MYYLDYDYITYEIDWCKKHAKKGQQCYLIVQALQHYKTYIKQIRLISNR